MLADTVNIPALMCCIIAVRRVGTWGNGTLVVNNVLYVLTFCLSRHDLLILHFISVFTQMGYVY